MQASMTKQETLPKVVEDSTFDFLKKKSNIFMCKGIWTSIPDQYIKSVVISKNMSTVFW